MVWAHFLWQAGCFIWEAAVAEQEVENRKREPPSWDSAQENQFQWEAVLRTLGWLVYPVCGMAPILAV